jgi:hypothetical protein
MAKPDKKPKKPKSVTQTIEMAFKLPAVAKVLGKVTDNGDGTVTVNYKRPRSSTQLEAVVEANEIVGVFNQNVEGKEAFETMNAALSSGGSRGERSIVVTSVSYEGNILKYESNDGNGMINLDVYSVTIFNTAE